LIYRKWGIYHENATFDEPQCLGLWSSDQANCIP